MLFFSDDFLPFFSDFFPIDDPPSALKFLFPVKTRLLPKPPQHLSPVKPFLAKFLRQPFPPSCNALPTPGKVSWMHSLSGLALPSWHDPLFSREDRVFKDDSLHRPFFSAYLFFLRMNSLSRYPLRAFPGLLHSSFADMAPFLVLLRIKKTYSERRLLLVLPRVHRYEA